MRNVQAGEDMRAHTLRTTLNLLCLAGLLVATAGCNRPRKVETGAQSDEQKAQRQQPAAERNKNSTPDPIGNALDKEHAKLAPDSGNVASPDAEETTSGGTTPGPGDAALAALTTSLKRLKFKARREVIAARTTIENIPSYRRSLEKFEREFEQWGMYTEVPREPGYDELKSAIAGVVGGLGLELLYYKVKESSVEPRALPEVIHGNKSFTFEDNDVRSAFQVSIRIPQLPRESQTKLLAELKALDRLLLIRRVKDQSESLLINMEGYWFPEERYPLHQVLPRDLKTEMQQLGITSTIEKVLRQDSVGYLQNAALSYKELNASLPKVNEAMGLLSRSKFLEARSAFFRKAVEAAAAATPLP